MAVERSGPALRSFGTGRRMFVEEVVRLVPCVEGYIGKMFVGVEAHCHAALAFLADTVVFGLLVERRERAGSWKLDLVSSWVSSS